jgi:hypothetical protein
MSYPRDYRQYQTGREVLRTYADSKLTRGLLLLIRVSELEFIRRRCISEPDVCEICLNFDLENLPKCE